MTVEKKKKKKKKKRKKEEKRRDMQPMHSCEPGEPLTGGVMHIHHSGEQHFTSITAISKRIRGERRGEKKEIIAAIIFSMVKRVVQEKVCSREKIWRTSLRLRSSDGTTRGGRKEKGGGRSQTALLNIFRDVTANHL